MASELHDLRAMLAALQKAMDEKMSGGEDLAALQKKIAEMSAQQVAQTAQLDKAWGYITSIDNHMDFDRSIRTTHSI